MATRLSDKERALRNISEAQFQSKVQTLMSMHGWLWFHAPDNIPRNGYIQNVKAGFPDLVAVRGGRVIYVELKTEVGKVSEAQQVWHQALKDAGQEVYVWRPSDTDAVVSTLKEKWSQ